MAVVFSNNGKTTLSANVSSSATSISVSDGSVFPSLGSGEIFFCTLDDGNNNEIVKVTAISSNTLTVVRAQESTTARAFSAGDAAELRLTAGILGLFSQTGVAITDEVEAYLDGGNSTPSFASITSGAISASDHIRIVDNKKLLMGSGDMFQIGHITDHSQITTYEGDLYIDQNADDKDIIFRSDNGSGGITDYIRLDGSHGQIKLNKQTIFPDSVEATFGTSGDAGIYHNGTHLYIDEKDAGRIFIRSSNEVRLNKYTGEYMVRAIADGAVELYHDNAKKFETTSGGVSVSGELDTTGNIAINKDVPKLTINNNTANTQSSIDIKNTSLYARYILDNDDLFRIYNQTSGFDTFAVKSDGDLYMGATKWFDLNRNLTNIASANVTGNITVSGTVDGRDVATDGSKLDGIESGATADQTASEILTAIKTVDGSGSGLDADTVDGFQASSFLRSDANDTATGALTIGGAVYGSYGSGSTDITGLINGSTFGSMITATGSGHHVIGLKDNDNNDSFAVISGSGNYTTDSTYDKLVFRAQANGTVTVGGGNLAVTGNITLTGTVDGRDIATDGSKLDGIESGATADQTASEILTAINTVDGSGSGLDADLLDGQHGSHYLNYNNFTNTPTIPTNNNQLTNGAGYTTNTGTVSSLSDLSITSTAAELNVLDGYTGSVTELNYLDTLHATGVTATEFDYLDGVTSNIQTQLNSKLSGINSSQVTTALGYTPTKSSSTSYSVWSQDNRNNNEDPDDLNRGLYVMFKTQSTIGLTASGTYAGVLHWRSYGTGSDLTGGDPIRIAYAEDGQLYKQIGTSATAWGSWYKMWDANNDGSGSGLDADLLDGQHGSHYLDYNNFTNTPTIPSLSGYATESYVNTQVSNLVDSAPGALNTLNELAAALGDDANFSTTVTNSIATKLALSGGTMTGLLKVSMAQSAGSPILDLHNSTNGNGVKIRFTDVAAGTSQFGHIEYLHQDSKSYGSGASFTIGSTESTTTILADGKLMYGEGIYSKPSSGTGAGTRKDSNWDTAYGWGNHASAGYLASSSYTAADVLTKIKTVDGSGSGLDADTLDGINGASFLRSDTNDTATGALTFSNNNNQYSGHHYFTAYDANGNHYPHYNSGSSNNGAQINLRVQQSGGSGFDVLYIANGNNNITWRGNKLWNAANDGSGSGLDADTLDGINSTSFLRSDAGDTSSATYTFTRTSTTPVFSITGHAGASNYNYFLRAGNDTYTTAAVHFVNGSTRTADHGANAYVIRNDNGTFVLGKTSQSTKIYGTGDLTYNDNEVWHAGNDGAGSSLDADLLDGQHGSHYLNYNNFTNTPTIPTNNNQLTNGAGYITGNQTITLTGDASGSGTTSINVTVADDSHNHIISNVDGLQTALNGKASLSGATFTGNVALSKANPVLILSDTTASSNADQVAYISFQDNGTEEAWIGWGSSGNTNLTIKNNIGSVVLDGTGTTVINDNLDLNGNADISGTITASTINTGQGATEVHLMNQNVRTTDSPTFDELTVTDFVKASGNNIKFSAGGTHVLNMDLNRKIYPQTDNSTDLGFNSSTSRFRDAYFSGVGNFGTINTGQGATEVYLMNQNVRSSDSPTFANLNLGASGTTPQINMLFNDHSSGAGWDTRIEIGKSDDLGAGTGTFPTYVPSGAYGTSIQANSDGVFFGMEEYSSGNFRPIIQWGDDDTDTPFRIKHENGSEFTVSYNGIATATTRLSAPQVYATVASGTAPLVVTSTTLVSNLNADRLDSQHGSYYLDYNNFTNTPTIPSLSGYATESYVNTQVSNLVDSAPGTLNTLNELAAALGDDANFSTTVTNSIATKLPLSGGTMTGAVTMAGQTWNGDITWNNGKNILVGGESSIDVSGSGYFQIWDSGSGAAFLKCDVGVRTEIGIAGSRGLKVHGEMESSSLDVNGNGDISGALNVGGNLTIADQIRIGDDAWLEDYNVANSVRVKGNQNNNLGFIAFGQQTASLGCNGTSTLSYNGLNLVNISGDLYSAGRKFMSLRSNSSNTERGPWNPTITSIRNSGRRLHPDEDFRDGSNSVGVYNNAGGGTVAHTREDATTNSGGAAPNSSGKVIRIYYNGGTASPGFGGFVQNIPSEDNHTFVQIFQAKLPTGKNLVIAENAQGTNNQSYWLTDTAGTGKWEWYARVSHCGNSGTFSSGGHVYVTGGSGAFSWYLASCTVIDVTEPNMGETSFFGNIVLEGDPTTSNQDRMIDFTGYDKEGTTDFSDRAFIKHTENTEGHGGSVLVLSSQNDSNDGIAFATNSSSQLKHNSNTIWDAGNDGSGSGLDADSVDGIQGASLLRSDAEDLYSPTRLDFGSSGGWDAVGFSNLTNLHMRDHNQFWVGAGNGTWFTGTANSKSSTSGLAADATKAHDLLITTMQSTSTYDRGITFAVDSGGAGNSGYRLGKWHSSNEQHSSKLTIDGGLHVRGGDMANYDYYADDYSTYWDNNSGGAYWTGDSDWIDPSITAGNALQIQAGNATTNANNPALQFHQYGYGGVQFRYDGPDDVMHLESTGSNRFDYFQIQTDHGNIQIGPMNTSYAHIYTNISGGFYFNKTALSANGNTIWHAGNDGSGSGLDADLLDGVNSGSFLRSDATDTSSGKLSFGFQVSNLNSVSGSQGITPFRSSYQASNRPGTGNYFTGAEYTFHDSGARAQLGFGSSGNNTVPHLYARTEGWSGSDGWHSWYLFWHSGNDGSGSGLDADLLDGQHGSYYAPTANPTFTGTVTGVQFKWNVDGSGHNYLGSDIYDGLVLHSRPGETIIYGSGETSSSVKAHRFMSSTTNNTTGLGNEVFSITAGGSAALSGTSFTAGGNTVWHAGNDGSGSGLDADTVDGIDIDAINTQGAIAYSSSSTQITGTTQQKVHQGTYGQRMTFTMGGPSGSAQNFGNIGDNSSVVGGNSDDFTIAAGADLVLGQGGYARLRFDGSTAHFFNPVKLGSTLQDNGGNTRISVTGRMYPLDVSVGSSPSKNMEYASSTLTVGSVDDDDFYLNLKGFGGNSNIQLDDGDIWVNGTSNSTAAYKFASNGHFHSNGDVIAYSSTLTASDKRLKENIVPLDSSLDKINKLQGVKYDWKNKDKGTNQLGLIAQEVEKVVPEVVKEVKDGLGDISGMKVVNYTALVPVLIEAIKEQQKELEYMKAEIKTLKGEK